MSKKNKMLAVIFAISIVAYNVILFVICGFTGHSSVFWISWIFMIVAFISVVGSVVFLGQKSKFLRDWLFGYPILKHSLIFVIAEFCASTLFIVLEKYVNWGWAFVIQFLFLCVYGVLAISCFIAKETIENVQNRISDKTHFIKLLRVDTEMMIEKCDDADTKEKCKMLAEAIRYSDPMSNESLFELEKNLEKTIFECDKAITEKNFTFAKELCEKAMLQLTERNKKCKALK